MTGRVQRLFDFIMRMDENADGAIQKDEAPERMARMFERMDANKDGVLTKEEVEAGARAQAQARLAGAASAAA